MMMQQENQNFQQLTTQTDGSSQHGMFGTDDNHNKSRKRPNIGGENLKNLKIMNMGKHSPRSSYTQNSHQNY